MKFTSRHKHRAIIDITSLIDLVFLLVIFFMVTSTLGSENPIVVHLPKAVQSGDYKKGTMKISITDKNEIYINDDKIDTNALINELKKRKSSITGSVIIRGDKQAHYDTMIRVMDSLNQAGIPVFNLSTIK